MPHLQNNMNTIHGRNVNCSVISSFNAKFCVTMAPFKLRRMRNLYADSENGLIFRFAYTSSKLHKDRKYWFGYHEEWDEFLAESRKAFLVLECRDDEAASAIPVEWIKYKLDFLSLRKNYKPQWHLKIKQDPVKGWHLYSSKIVHPDISSFLIYSKQN